MLYSISEYIIPISKATSSFEKLSFLSLSIQRKPKKEKIWLSFILYIGKTNSLLYGGFVELPFSSLYGDEVV